MHRNPRRAVIDSELKTGPRGGDYWWVTLDCGHHKAVYIPAFQPMPALIQMRARPVRSRRSPEHCSCLLCGALSAPSRTAPVPLISPSL